MKSGSGVAVALGQRVREARKELGMSQATLAGDELTKGFISQLESGQVRPSIRSLQIIATRLGKPLDYFLGDEPLAAGKRLAFHRLAADAAVERADWLAAREHVNAALAGFPDAPDRAQLLQVLARTEIAEGRFEQAFDLVDQALALEPAPLTVAQLLYERGRAYSECGTLVAATEAFESCRDVIERNEIIDPRLRARLMIALGTMYRRLDRTTKAIVSYQSALSTASRSSELAMAARGYMGIAATHYDSGELDAAIANYRRALELFQRVSDIDFELNALQSIATVQLESGDLAHAEASARRALGRAIEVGNDHWAAVAEVILSRIELRQGRGDEALRLAMHADGVLAATNDRVQRADALGAVAAAHEERGDHAAADEAYHRSIDLYTAAGDVADRSGMAAEYARVLRARGEIDAAFEMLELARGGSATR